MGLVLSLKLVMECRGDSRYLSLLRGSWASFFVVVTLCMQYRG